MKYLLMAAAIAFLAVAAFIIYSYLLAAAPQSDTAGTFLDQCNKDSVQLLAQHRHSHPNDVEDGSLVNLLMETTEACLNTCTQKYGEVACAVAAETAKKKNE